MSNILNILCLGDSYTIGECVPLHESFPYQTVQNLRKQGFKVAAPEIIAKTGWTSFELLEHLVQIKINEKYDFVTLLIGVNNQYRNLPIQAFAEDFNLLLAKAIKHCSANNVFVLSIPDWGVTPFANEKNSKNIAKEIDVFNTVIESISLAGNCNYINITEITRLAINDLTLIATDGLHPSGKEYAKWANLLVEKIYPINMGKNNP